MNKQQLKKETEEAKQEEQAMINELQNKELLINIIKEIHKEGVVGEEDNILILILKTMLRLVCDAQATSSNLLVSDLSGGGKDYLVKQVCGVILPENNYIHRTGLTPTVFTYWKMDWNKKVLHIEDPEEDLINCDGFKTMASGGTHVTVTKKQEAIDFKIKGKPVMIVTSLDAKIKPEGIRRWNSIRIDTSPETTKQVIRNDMLRAKQRKQLEINQALRDGLHKLIITKCVIIPYADKLFDIFPCTIVNRTLDKVFIDFIKASAVLHQYQREKDEYGNIIANWFDYDYAIVVFRKCLGKHGMPINKVEEEFLEILASSNNTALSVKEILPKFSRGKDWIYSQGNVERLKSLYLIGETSEWDEQLGKDVRKFYCMAQFININKMRYSDGILTDSDGGKNNSTDTTLKKGRYSGFLENVIENVTKIRKQQNLPVFLHFFNLSENLPKKQESLL